MLHVVSSAVNKSKKIQSQQNKQVELPVTLTGSSFDVLLKVAHNERSRLINKSNLNINYKINELFLCPKNHLLIFNSVHRF